MTATKCTPEIVAKIVATLAADVDHSLTYALVEAEVGMHAWSRWKAHAAKGEQPYADAVAAIMRANWRSEPVLAKRLAQAARGDIVIDPASLNALKHVLAHRYRDGWGETTKYEIGGIDGQPIEHAVMSYDDLQRRLAETTARDGAGADADAVGEPGGRGPGGDREGGR